jgi:hypothetical protein
VNWSVLEKVFVVVKVFGVGCGFKKTAASMASN